MGNSKSSFRISFRPKNNRPFNLSDQPVFASTGSMSDYPEVEAEYKRYMKMAKPTEHGTEQDSDSEVSTEDKQ